jgi:hypothetical protein
MLVGCAPSFHQADIDAMNAEIKRSAEAQGFVVDDIQLVREAPRRVTGFAKVHKVVPLVGRLDVNWTCAATMGEQGGRYIWRCAP